MLNRLFFSLIFSAVLSGVQAQELLLPLINNLYNNNEDYKTKSLRKSTNPLPLPFRDDFSYPGPHPDPRIWADINVLINNSFAVHAKTWGVATFDALSGTGHLYNSSQTSPNQFEADFLTSKPINLAGLAPKDSVLLTFYFQPQGKGGDPRQRDSLVVEFFKGLDEFGQEKWQSVWRASGQTLLQFAGNQHPYFKRAAIFVTDPAYFNNQFRFRIRNFASLQIGAKNPPNFAGNYGIWNVDYLLLDKHRSVLNTTYHDIAFAEGAGAFIKHYSYMPWLHFIQNPGEHLKSKLQNKITNLGQQEFNYSYLHFLTDEQENNLGFYDGGSWNILPFSSFGYETYPTFANPSLHVGNALPLTAAPRREFTLVRAIREGIAGDGYKRNDTVKFKQGFDNFYAYDFGVPTSGYGVVGSKPKAGLKFNLAKEDQLKAIQILINRTYNQNNNIPFRITVWKNLQPAQLLYRSPVLNPQFSDFLNGFYTHILGSPITVSGTIYVGWEQEAAGFMNVGWDFNVENSGDIVFYNDGSGWFPSNFMGSLMIRPVVGELGSVANPKDPTEGVSLKIFPNPVKGNLLNIQLTGIIEGGYTRLEFFDMFGRKVHNQPFTETVDLSKFASGVYILRVIDPAKNMVQNTRFVVAR